MSSAWRSGTERWPVKRRTFSFCCTRTYVSARGLLHNIAAVGNEKNSPEYCGVAPRGRSIERPLLINGYAYLAVSFLDNGSVASNS
jgi:hypothetical protein